MEIQERDVDIAACIPVNVMAPLASVMSVVLDWGGNRSHSSLAQLFSLAREFFQRLFMREPQVVEKAPYAVIAVRKTPSARSSVR